MLDFENDPELLDVTLHGIAAHMLRHGYPDSARAATTAANKLKAQPEGVDSEFMAWMRKHRPSTLLTLEDDFNACRPQEVEG